MLAYSGGKDSTLLLQLAFETLLASKTRKRHLHIVANDTQVESPLVIGHLKSSLADIGKVIDAKGLPASITVTRPHTDQTFWVCVIGKGYMPPTRNFRWCTDRLKIQPTTEYITRIARSHKETLLLIGTRKAESASRRRRMEKYAARSSGYLNPHSQIKNCQVFSPIAELTDNEVWTILLQTRPPWGGTHRRLITLYRNAGKGECPLVLTKEDAPSCGSSSPRFGCWTCTVVKKDKSLGGLIDSGHEELEPLYSFREWLLALREDDRNRMPVRRDGTIKLRTDGSRVQGPFTMEVRREIYRRLKELEQELNMQLISKLEEGIIREIWQVDEAQYASRNALNDAAGIAR